MSVNVNTFKLFTEFVSNKVQSGNAVSPSQFNDVANRAQMQLFEKDFQTFLMTNEVSEYLKTFFKNKIYSTLPTGEISYPSDFEHLASLRRYYVNSSGAGKEVPMIPVKNSSWGEIQVSALNQPTLRYPKFSEFSDVIRILPRTPGIVMMDYFKKPTAPVWGYTVTNNRPVYNPATSTNFEWSEFSLNNVAAIYLSLIGVNLKDSELAQFSELYKQQTNSNL